MAVELAQHSVPLWQPHWKKGLLPTPSSWKSDHDFGFCKDGEGVAIEALGPRFNLTEVRLWDQHPTKSATEVECPISKSPVINQYWSQRYDLFSKFDEGVKMDVEGWYSVTPEAIAKHHARRCQTTGTVLDCFTGVGGNVIQFAQTSGRVIAIDIDPLKLHYAKHNSEIYGADQNKIHFVLGDSMVLGPQLRADVVFLSPPWGGPDYRKQNKYDINTMLKPCSGQHLFDIAKKIAPKVVMFLPKNVDVNQLAELAVSASPPWSLEVEKNYLNGKLKAITAYFTKSNPRW